MGIIKAKRERETFGEMQRVWKQKWAWVYGVLLAHRIILAICKSLKRRKLYGKRMRCFMVAVVFSENCALGLSWMYIEARKKALLNVIKSKYSECSGAILCQWAKELWLGVNTYAAIKKTLSPYIASRQKGRNSWTSLWSSGGTSHRQLQSAWEANKSIPKVHKSDTRVKQELNILDFIRNGK